MKIALISFLLGPEGGGASTMVERLRDAFIQDGWEVIMISTHKERGITVTEEQGAKTYRFLPRNLYWVGDKDNQPKALRALWQIIDIWNYHSYYVVKEILKQEKPDIVHTHKLRGLSPSVWHAAKAAGDLPVVHTCHDFELISPVGTLQGRIGKWAGNGKFPFCIYQWIRALFSRSVDLAVAPSRIVLDKHTENGFFEHSKQWVIQNTHGYRLEQMEAHRSALNQKALDDEVLRVLFIGRLEPEKGVLTLVEATQMAIKSGSRIHLDIVGSGSLEGSLRNKVADQSSFDIHGSLFGELKDRLLMRADVVIVPSEVEESFGLVVSEAFAFGKPVIVSNIGALPELVRDSYNGFIIKPFDPIGIKQLMIKLSNEPEILKKMRVNCFNAAASLTIENSLKDHLDIYSIVRGNIPD